MPANPAVHHRHSIRLPGYDYSSPGIYFVTLVAWQREPLFGEIVNGAMRLSLAGQCAFALWQSLGDHFPVTIDEFVVMPDHLHGILIINPTDSPCLRQGEASGDGVRSGQKAYFPDASPLRLPHPTPPDETFDIGSSHGTVPGSLGAIIQNYKSVSTRRINAARGTPGAPVWLRNYYERIVRDQEAWACVCAYIRANPLRWSQDHDHGHHHRCP
jgi:putative transposase